MYNIGSILPGGWEIEQKLGEGSYGVVYQARRALAGSTERAAIKVISIPRSENDLQEIRQALGTDDPQALQTYLEDLKNTITAEYLHLAELQGHTNIVACSDIQIVEKEAMPGYDITIRMELLTSLSSRIRNEGMSRQDVLKLGMDICTALSLLQTKNIVHRDIKPQNIFVNEHGDYKLGDFGTARKIQGTSVMMSIKGTSAFIAPEIAASKPSDFTADIYSLGLVLYRLLNGNKAPFMLPGQASTASSMDAANARRLSGEPLPPPVHADIELAQIILRACAFEPRNRWQTADAFRSALAELAEGTLVRPAGDMQPLVPPPVQAAPEEKSTQQQPAAPASRKITWRIAAVTAAAALLLGGAFLLGKGSTPGETSQPTAAPASLPPATPLPAETAAPQETKSGDYTIGIYPDGTCVITSYHGNDKHVRVPEKLNGKPVVRIGKSAFTLAGMTSLTIPNTVTHIHESAFFLCRSLTSVTLSSRVGYIGAGAFAGCPLLSSLIVDPANPYYYAKDHVLFSRDGRLVAYAAGLPSDAYSVPEGTTVLGANAFCECRAQSIKLPESLTTIERFAFQGAAIRQIAIPAGVSYLEPGLFLGCNRLEQITVDWDNPFYFSSSGVLCTKGGALICYPAGKTETAYAVPGSINAIVNYAFSNAALTEITIPDSVVSIGSKAFDSTQEGLVLRVKSGSFAHDWALDHGIACATE